MSEITDEQKLFIQRVKQVLTWRTDVDSGEMVEQRNPETGLQYCKHNLSIEGGITQNDLYAICNVVNATFKACKSSLRVNDSMGEFIPSIYTGKL